MDDDDSGEVSKEEFVRGLSKLGLAEWEEELKAVYDCFDIDGNGALEYQELTQIIRQSATIKPKITPRVRNVVPRPGETAAQTVARQALLNRDTAAPAAPAAPPWWLRPRAIRQTAYPYTAVQIRSEKWLPGGSVKAWQLTPDAFPGLNRCSSKLAILMHPASKHTALDEPSWDPSLPWRPGSEQFPSGVLRSAFVQNYLVDEGFGVLSFEATRPGADSWASEGDAATAALLAVFEYVVSHHALRYCRIALFGTGVGATAALVALGKAPALFEGRVKVVVATEPVMDGNDVPITHCAPSVPVLLVSHPTPPTRLQLPKCHALQKLLTANDVPCEIMTMQGPDDLEYFSEEPDYLLAYLLKYLGGLSNPYEELLRSPRTPRATFSRRGTPRATRLGVLTPRANAPAGALPPLL